MKQLCGKTALITGASSGIGRAIAWRLGALRCPLILVARREARLEELAGDIRSRHATDVHVIPADLARPDAASCLHAAVTERKLAVDILVNNAGFGIWEEFGDVDLSRHEEVMEVNVGSVVRLTRLFLPGMVARKEGYILLLGSIASFLPVPRMALYGACKALVLSLGAALRRELRGTGVRVTTLCPGGTDTEFLDVSGQGRSRLAEMALMSADRVAAAGLRGLARGRRAVIPGWSNELMMLVVKFAPAWCNVRAAELFLRLGAGPCRAGAAEEPAGRTG